jgi:hypothetical protein
MNPHLFLPQIRFGVREATAFVGHSFSDDDAEVVKNIIDFLSRLGLKCSTGKRPEARGVSEKVRERIAAAEIFVGVFTQRDKKVDGTYTTTSYTIEEKSTAISLGKRLLLFVEDGVSDFGGLQGDHEYIPFKRVDFGRSVIQAMDYVLSITRTPFEVSTSGGNISVKFGPSQSPDQMLERYRALVKARPSDVESRATLAKILLDTRPGDSETVEQYKTLVAEKPLTHDFQHNLGHAYENSGDLASACRHYELALACNGAGAKSFLCYGKCLYRYGLAQAPRKRKAAIAKARNALVQAMSSGEESMKRQALPILFLIDNPDK